MDCPKCTTEDLDRDSVDVGVGIIYGPYGCHVCGWSENRMYDCSDGDSEHNRNNQESYTDQFGRTTKISVIKDKLSHFGIPEELVDEVFKVRGDK